jgi:hypothetical protein
MKYLDPNDKISRTRECGVEKRNIRCPLKRIVIKCIGYPTVSIVIV